MASNIPPTETVPIFDSSLFVNLDNEPNLTYSDIKLLYATYNTSSPTQTLNNIIVNGLFTWSGSYLISVPLNASASTITTSTYNAGTMDIAGVSPTGVSCNLTNGNMTSAAPTVMIISGTSQVLCDTNVGKAAFINGVTSTLVNNTFSYTNSVPVSGTVNFQGPSLTISGTGTTLSNPLGNTYMTSCNANVGNNIRYLNVVAKGSCRPTSLLTGATMGFLGSSNYNFNGSACVFNATTFEYTMTFTVASTNANYVVVAAGYSWNLAATTYTALPTYASAYNISTTGFTLMFSSSENIKLAIGQLNSYIDIVVYQA